MATIIIIQISLFHSINIHRLSLEQSDLTAIRIDRDAHFEVHRLHLQAHKESNTSIDTEREQEKSDPEPHTPADGHGRGQSELFHNSTMISEDVGRAVEIGVVKTSLPDNAHVSETHQAIIKYLVATACMHAIDIIMTSFLQVSIASLSCPWGVDMHTYSCGMTYFI